MHIDQISSDKSVDYLKRNHYVVKYSVFFVGDGVYGI